MRAPLHSTSSVSAYRYHASLPRSAWQVRVGDESLDAMAYPVADFASAAVSAGVEVLLEAPGDVRELAIRPASRNVQAEVSGRTVRFAVSGPCQLVVEAEGMQPLMLYLDPADEVQACAARSGPGERRFRAGRVYDVGELVLAEGESVVVEGGAWVRGALRAKALAGVRIVGHGVLDNDFPRAVGGRRQSILLEDCREARVQGLVMVSPGGWMVVPARCDGVVIQGVKQLAHALGTDGVDVCGSCQVRIQDCFLRNGDDCVAIKAVHDWVGDVEDVVVERCVLYPHAGGSAMEIGFETRCDLIRDIVFRDCDVPGVHGYGCVFGIHTGDRAEIRDVLYERIRIEHCYNKLVDFRILDSRWNKDPCKGQVRGVTLRDIDWRKTPYNDGYTVSLIGGHDSAHTVENVLFENFRIDGRKIESLDALDLHTRHAAAIEVR